jgi:hypothetical protein
VGVLLNATQHHKNRFNSTDQQTAVSTAAVRRPALTPRMPPNGLYPVPRNHLYSASSSAPRPQFNTLHFAEPELEPALESVQHLIEETAQAVNGPNPEKMKRRKKKHPADASGGNEAVMAGMPSAEISDDEACPASAVGKKTGKKEKKKKSRGTPVEGEVTRKAATPEDIVEEAILTAGGTEERKAKNRKKKHSCIITTEDDGIHADNADLEATSTATNLGEPDGKSKVMTTYRDVDDALKSARKSAKKRKRVKHIEHETASADGVGESNDHSVLGGEWLEQLESSASNINATLGTPKREDVLAELPARKKLKTKRKSVDTNAEESQGTPARVSDVPFEAIAKQIPVDRASKKKDAEVKALQHSKVRGCSVRSNLQALNNVSQSTPPFIQEPKNTPVPLPPNSSQAAQSDLASPQQRLSKAGHTTSDLSPTETPPRKLVATTLRKIVGAATACPRPKATPSLTASNLERYTQPLNDDAKPRPLGTRPVSVSSASSMSIKDAFARQHKQKLSPVYVSDNDSNPFFIPSSQTQPHMESQPKSDGPAFGAAFQALLAIVNMANEQAYLAQHLELRALNDAAGPLPCLKSATGCNSKLEQQLSTSRENTTNSSIETTSSDENQLSFDVSVAATVEAEKFLHNAVVAGIPVPAGNLEATYTLYCPKYIETHIDKYGYGLRELTISKPSGFNGNTYTARLSIPPRPMAYTILSFNPPPNASFRTIRLTTSAEGYTMDLVILGHGYILLRVDVGLFLTGKSTAMGANVGREICMEFVGVKNDALQWRGLGDNVKTAQEKDARRLKEIAEKEEHNKKQKEESWEKRKVEMKKARKDLDSSPVKGSKVETKEKKEKRVTVEQSPKKTAKAGTTKASAIDVDNKMTKEEEEVAWERRKKEMTQEKKRLDREKLKAGTMAGVPIPSSSVKKATATTTTGSVVSSSPMKRASPIKKAQAIGGIAASASPKKMGRPSNADLYKRNRELEALLRAKEG